MLRTELDRTTPSGFAALAIAWAFAASVIAVVASKAHAGEPTRSSEREAKRVNTYGAEARVRRQGGDSRGRSTSTVTRKQLEERLPRSAPDALRYEPGVYVQQTAHGQGSPYVRGLTGQQVLLMFDGVRLNNGIYRQGPNQYFFTVDTQTIDHIRVTRGSASVLHGSDALGGVVEASPRAPRLEEDVRGVRLHPHLLGRGATADGELGGRAETNVQLGRRTAALIGVGYRDVGRLESGGIVRSPTNGSIPLVPRFDADGRTQLGTGFREGTFDARIVHQLKPSLQLVGALYGYRQYDAPRTDQCPPPYAPVSDCLTYKEQFRTLGYVSLRGDPHRDLREFSLTLSWQRQHERRELDRPLALTTNRGRNDVDTLGLAFRASTRWFGRSDERTGFRVRYGADAYRDGVSSLAWISYSDIQLTRQQTRGQYVDGSRYLMLGTFGEAEVKPHRSVTVRAGGRTSIVDAAAPPDAYSGTQSVNKTFSAIVGRAGVEGKVSDDITLLANIDQGFRAPNLDDLTSRTQAGPGFQFENPNLKPERSLTAESGVKLDVGDVELEAWVFHTWIHDAIIRSLRLSGECPPETPQCPYSWSRYQLVNGQKAARIVGADGAVTFQLPFGIVARATASWAFGEGPNTAATPDGRATSSEQLYPLSRVPPLNGTGEIRWRELRTGIYVGAAVRWALRQSRLAPTDLSDKRIPEGGTPGYAVFDIRAGWRWRDKVLVALVFENVFDAAYRVHGSSVNGPARGLLLSANVGL